MVYWIEEFKNKTALVTNDVEKVAKCAHFLDLILQIYSVIYYSHTRIVNKVSKSIIEVILYRFHNKNPLSSSWADLLKNCSLILALSDKISSKIQETNCGKSVTEIANLYRPADEQRACNSYDINTFIADLMTIRNKAYAHGKITDERAKIINQLGLFESLVCFSQILNNLIDGRVLLSKNTSYDVDKEGNLDFNDFSSFPIVKYYIPISSIEGHDPIYVGEYYYYYKDSLIPLRPFLICSNEELYVYSGVNKKNFPQYQQIIDIDQTPITKKSLTEAFKETIKEDIDLLHEVPIRIMMRKDNNVIHNVPTPFFDRFIGRTQIISEIIRNLDHRRHYLITVSGIGGVGKSAIAIETARTLIELPSMKYQYIIWVSAKWEFLTPEGIKQEEIKFTQLNQLLNVILDATGFDEYKNHTFKYKKEQCLEILSMDSFLLILDNFETVENPSAFLDFFEAVGDQSEGTKILLTTRHQLGSSEKIIEVKEFDYDDYREFCKYLVREKFCLDIDISDGDVKALHNFTGGVALATEVLIGQIKNESSIKKLVKNIETKNFATKEEILKFSFAQTFESLDEKQKKVLFSCCILDNPSKDSICFVSSINEFDVEEIIGYLNKLSLINHDSMNPGSYSMLPLTRSFLTNKLLEYSTINEDLTLRLKEYRDIVDVRQSSAIYHQPFKKDLSLSDTFALSAYNRAKCGDIAKSEEYFQKATEYGDKNPLIYYYKAKVELEIAGSVNKDYFNKALSFSDDLDFKVLLHTEMGIGLYNQKELVESAAAFQNAIRLKSSCSLYHYLGKCYYEIGRNQWKKGLRREMMNNYKKSSEAFLKSIYDNPDVYQKNSTAISYYYLAKINIYTNNHRDALDYVNKGLELQPNNLRFQEQKTFILEKIKKNDHRAIKTTN
ncbi:MAG: hypothetical protein LHW45_00475 [Candidatus Cloacimonetes bacterium]|nr:hypothetical protein [Candidatus Cloacimonadota bacterium]MDY0366094.1 NB-ARC domain-containing protein [Candidatus Syntrophosphaera sp.]